MLKELQAPPLNPQLLNSPQVHQLPETGYLRIWHVIGDPTTTTPTPALIPISRTSWLNGVKSGKYPKPVKLSERTTAWRVEDIRALIVSMGES